LELQLLEAQKSSQEVGIKCKATLLETGSSTQDLVPAILNYSRDQEDIDLIMIMTQQENRLVEFFIGSAAQQIIRESTIPVMSIIPKDLGFSYIQF